jgi:CelD/BcsL family acetyltransferase involved in cellulose biosynthesis
LQRRLAEAGEVAYTYHDPSSAALEAIFAVHMRRWEGRSEPMQGLFSTARLRAFTRSVVTALGAEGQVRVSSLSCCGTPVAVCLGYVAKGRYHYHKPAFDPDFGRYKPGHLLIASLMESALADGVTEFDFGRGAGQYKDSWSDGSRTAVSLLARRRHSWDPGVARLLRRVGGSYRVRRLSWERDPSTVRSALIAGASGARR